MMFLHLPLVKITIIATNSTPTTLLILLIVYNWPFAVGGFLIEIIINIVDVIDIIIRLKYR